MSKSKNHSEVDVNRARAIARSIETGQIIDLGNVPSRDLGLITQGLVKEAAESYLKEHGVHLNGVNADPMSGSMDRMS